MLRQSSDRSIRGRRPVCHLVGRDTGVACTSRLALVWRHLTVRGGIGPAVVRGLPRCVRSGRQARADDREEQYRRGDCASCGWYSHWPDHMHTLDRCQIQGRTDAVSDASAANTRWTRPLQFGPGQATLGDGPASETAGRAGPARTWRAEARMRMTAQPDSPKPGSALSEGFGREPIASGTRPAAPLPSKLRAARWTRPWINSRSLRPGPPWTARPSPAGRTVANPGT